MISTQFNTSKLGALATIDTGAEVSVMPVRVYKQLFPNDMDNDMVQNLEPCNMKLTAFNKTDINVYSHQVLLAYNINVCFIESCKHYMCCLCILHINYSNVFRSTL